jgi:murein DD-endopeptidase MepM/ murein hydrolase activator NlpD
MSQHNKKKKILWLSILLVSCATGRPSPAPIETGMTTEQLRKLYDNTTYTNSKKTAPIVKPKENDTAVEVSTVNDEPINDQNNNVAHCPNESNSSAFVFPIATWTTYKNFSPELKGIDVKSKYGSAVYAAKDGKVVYSGDGLVGYGNIIIVKHDDGMLTAYAFNKANLVKVGDTVKQCQKIATVGYMYKQTAGLHFEIRKNGKPLNPLATISNK